MVKHNTQLDLTFSALSHPTRRAILARLAEADVSVGELAQPFEISLPAVSKHLRVLERAGLLVQDPQGRVRRCKLRAAPMREAAEWVQRYRRFWIRQLDALAKFVEAEEPKKVRHRT